MSVPTKTENEVIIEAEWIDDNLNKCSVKLMPMGHRCGYVEVHERYHH